MTLEQKIAECNRVGFPMLAFIDSGLALEKDFGLVNERTTLFDEFLSTLNWLETTALILKLDWLEREADRLMHPVVLTMIEQHDCDWYGIMLEWPHVSQDGERLAYTRNAAAGVQDRQTVTSLGKYLARHFCDLPSNVLRDAAALFTPDRFEIRDTVEGIVNGVQEGPTSCMKWRGWEGDTDTHPYSCYAPENGWTLALRISNDRIDGRCLCHTRGNNKIFVRSFARDLSSPDTGYSNSDTALEAWLKNQGYTHESGWPSYCQLDTKDSSLFPYIDGDVDRCDDRGFIVDEGEYLCDNTDGTPTNGDDGDDDDEYVGNCVDCRDTVYEHHERTWVGRYSDQLVCDCCSNSYSFAYGASGEQYYVPDDEVVYVDGQNYEIEHLSDNDIVKLKDGGYAELTHTVCIDDNYYLADDDDVTCFSDEHHLKSNFQVVRLDKIRPGTEEEYAHVDDTWTCAETGNVYHNDEDYELIDGDKHHPDSAAAQAFCKVQAKQLTLELEPS